MGILAGILENQWIFAFVAFGAFIAVFYNLGLWQNRFHSDLWFAFSWGAFPVLTSYWVHASRLDVAVVIVAVSCFFLTLAQRTLSTPVRTIRRKAVSVEGYIDVVDGERIELDSERIIEVPESALALLVVAIVVLAAGLLTYRLQTQ